MIDLLRLRNFRGFEDHSMPLRPLTLIVGRNNAGKSSLVEALRLISLVTTRIHGLGFHEGPAWGGIPKREVGVRPSLKGAEISFGTLFHRYGDPPAIIEATFTNGTGLRLYLGGEDTVHAVILDTKGQPARSKAAAIKLGLPTVEILPQVAPLDPAEVVLTSDYVRRVASSNLASRHFRNQLRVFPDSFSLFRSMVEETWPGLRVLELTADRGYPGDPLTLTLRDDDFAAEASAMGHGLQMWLQTMWFLARARDADCVILDEPDVYMHPDLQRRLVRYIKRRQQQIIVATHSVEMMAEVEPDEILVVDRRHRLSRFATGTPAIQKLVEHIGSVHNVQLAKLWNAKKCLLVEGKDIKLLSLLHHTLFPDADPLELLPHLPVGGWGGWPYAIGSSRLLQNSGGETITVYCIFDSDYHSAAAIARRYEDARRSAVQLHIWRRKEIENYLLVPTALTRFINSRISARTQSANVLEVINQIEVICAALRNDTFDAISAEILAENRALGAGGANREARKVLDLRWSSTDDRMGVVSGKDVFARLSEWSQTQFGVSLAPSLVARAIDTSEIADEMASVLTAIERGTGIPAILR